MCCGHSTKNNVARSNRLAPANHVSHVVPVLPAEGMTMMGFLGRGTSYRPFYGHNQRYLFGGKHHLIGNVLDSDVALFLGMTENGKHLFEIIKILKPLRTNEELDALMDENKTDD